MKGLKLKVPKMPKVLEFYHFYKIKIEPHAAQEHALRERYLNFRHFKFLLTCHFSGLSGLGFHIEKKTQGW